MKRTPDITVGEWVVKVPLSTLFLEMKMKMFLAFLLFFFMVGCNGPLNKEVDSNLAGPPGPPETEVFFVEVTISSTPGGSISPWTGTRVCQSQVMFIQADAFPGYVFSHWSGDVADEFKASTIILVKNVNVSVKAYFVKTYNG